MDASVGLKFSLQLLQRYQRNGVLQAQIHHVPGIRGTCIAYVHLTDGSVTGCYLENKRKQRFQSSIDLLCRVDDKRGPFEWIFQQKQPSVQSQVFPSTRSLVPTSSPPPLLASTTAWDHLVPKVVAPLCWEQFSHWTPEQKLVLLKVWKVIDGKCTVQNMKASLPYAPEVVNEILDILWTLCIISLLHNRLEALYE